MTHLFTLLQIAEEPVISGMEALQKVSIKLLIRLLIDFVTMYFLIKWVYFSVYKRRELFFTFFIFNLVIFLICFLLNKVDLSMGAAFGLFAVFSMLRYRTEDISIKDMTYLFLVIAIGLINSVTKIKGADDTYEYMLLILINGLILGVTYFMESKQFFKREEVQIINYDQTDLLHADSRALLLEDLKKRTGLNIHRVSVTKMDFLKGGCQLKVYYFVD